MSERLDSWKAIATYLGREVRTVQRWAKARSLPVHHLPGGNRPRVFAYISEIDAWLNASRAAPPTQAIGIAVLPFAPLGGNDQDRFFGAGLADDLINELVRVAGLRVIARTSSFACASENQDVREIGIRLGAEWLVEGSVRRDRQRIRVSAQLVNTRDGGHAWSERYERQPTDSLRIQDDIAQSIAVALKLTLTPENAAARPADPDAYDLWVKARAMSQLLTPEAFAEARRCYEAAIARDAEFGRPYFGLADLLFYGAEFGLVDPATAVPRARDAIVRSLELDDRFGEAHALLGVFCGLLEYDWVGAETAFRRAFELSPGSAAVLSQHAWYHLVPKLHLDAAVEEARRAVTLDPLSPSAHGRLGMVLVAARLYEPACDACRTALQLAPGLWWLHWFYGTALLLRGRVEDGMRQCWRVYEHIRRPPVIGSMGAVCGLFSQREKAPALLAELEDIARNSRVPPTAFALAYLGLGDDRVFEWLDRAIDERDPMAYLLPSLPLYDGLRSDPRFPLLLEKMGLA